MTVQAAFAVVDRAFDEVFIRWLVSDVDGDQSLYLGLPAGFGDCALMEAFAVVSANATLQAAFESSGPRFGLNASDAGIPVDVGFCARWQLTGATTVSAHAAPDQVQFWKEQEVLNVSFPEIDTNATPTGDLTVQVKVRRLRPYINQAPDPRDQQFFLTS